MFRHPGSTGLEIPDAGGPGIYVTRGSTGIAQFRICTPLERRRRAGFDAIAETFYCGEHIERKRVGTAGKCDFVAANRRAIVRATRPLGAALVASID
jgi:hypothetical protein